MNKKLKSIFLFVCMICGLFFMVGMGEWVIQVARDYSVIKNPNEPIAYIKSTNQKFMSIEKALEVAENDGVSTEIYVIPGTNPTISKNCTLAAGDILYFPYTGETYEDPTRNEVTNTNFADYNQSSVEQYRKNKVTILSNVQFTNNGTIYVGGKLGKGQGNQRPTGHTVAEYCELNLENNATIENNGEIVCYGYIKESSSNNGSKIHLNSGSIIELPFIVYDFRGGSYSSACNSEGVFPLKIFDFANSQVEMIFEYNSTLYGSLAAYANNNMYVADRTKVVSSDNALFLMGEGASISIKYQSSNPEYTSNDYKTNVSLDNINETKIIVDGNVSFSSLTLSLGGSSFNTSDFFCPLCFKYDIIINSGTTTLLNKAKFYSGATLTVNPGATLNINADMMMYREYREVVSTGGGSQYPLSTGNAKLINNGTVNLNSSFAGIIETSVVGAKIITSNNFVSTLKTKEVITGKDLGMTRTYHEITGYGIGLISNNGTQPTEYAKFVANQTYQSEGTYWNGTIGTGDITETVGAEEDGSCLLPETLILMSDYTYKQAKDIVAGDMVMVLNHYTGKLDVAPVVFNDYEEKQFFNVVQLHFSNNQKVGVIYEHGFFDLDLNQYVYITENNYQEYIGHRFYAFNEYYEKEIVTLESVQIETKYTECYSPVSANHLNIITEGLLSMPGGIKGLFNIFELDENQMINQEKMQADIEKYGLFTYEEFETYMSKEAFEMFNVAYVKVSLGKGLMTIQDVQYLLERYSKYIQ